MRPFIKVLLVAVLAVALALPLTGCGLLVRRVPRPVSNETSSVPLGAATAIRANVTMGFGRLAIDGAAATGTVNADFTYTQPQWKPRLDYTVNATEGRLDIWQREFHRPTFGTQRNDWRVHLPAATPIELTVRLGAGESELHLGGLRLERLNATLGAGQTSIDLRGLKESLIAQIEGGVGELTVTVPRDVGVRIAGDREGVGSFSAPGFHDEGGDLVNDAYATAKQRIELDIRHGVGDVQVVSED